MPPVLDSSQVRAVVFDMDGTLLNSLPYVLKALSYALEPFTDKTLNMEMFGTLGAPPERFFHDFVRTPEQVGPALERLHRYHSLHGLEMDLFAGAESLLRDLRQAGLKTAIWTGRDRTSCLALLARTGIEGLLDQVVCGDDLATHKPDPEGLRLILDRFGLRSEELVFAGDADVDVQGGHACGVATLLIRHSRVPTPEVGGLAWRQVGLPGEAYQLLRGLLLSGKN